MSKKKQSLAEETRKDADPEARAPSATALQRTASLERLATEGNVQGRRSSFIPQPETGGLSGLPSIGDDEFAETLCTNARRSVEQKLVRFISKTFGKAPSAEQAFTEAETKGASARYLYIHIYVCCSPS